MNARDKQVSPEIITALKSHVPLHVVCDYLKFYKKPTARSWDDLFGHNISEQKLFLDLLTEILCFGKKTVFAYNAEDIDLAELDSATFTEHNILEMLKHASNKHTLFRRSIGKRFSAYTFSCKKAAFETYILTQNDLSADALKLS